MNKKKKGQYAGAVITQLGDGPVWERSRQTACWNNSWPAEHTCGHCKSPVNTKQFSADKKGALMGLKR